MDRFTQNLRRARKAAGLTQQQLADRLHVTRQSVSSWELGRTEPDLQTLTELAEVFGTDAGSLLGEAGRPAYPRLQKRFVTGFAVCAGLLLAVSGLELGLFAYWRKLLLHDYGPAAVRGAVEAVRAAASVVCFWAGRGVLFRDVVARPVRKTGEASASACGAGAGLAGACADGAVPCRCAGKPRRRARLACTAASKTCGKNSQYRSFCRG